MAVFLFGLVFLVAGYFLYGAFVEKVLAPDGRATPCMANPDGVDRIPLPKWKNMLIQLLNIAGVGPVIGVISGIKFGKIALLIIPVGCILLGAVHDFAGGMMSIRSNGANLPKMIRENLGRWYSSVFSWVMLVLLLLVVAVFINVPANLIDRTVFPDVSFFWWAVALIFIYYIVATVFPVDKIIGSLYPFFGALLVIGSFAMFVALAVEAFKSPEIFGESAAFVDFRQNVFNKDGRSPVFPLLFVTIACGIISGFHATQSPIVARTMRSEREARVTFYGMMVAEGIIAMIWAAAGLAMYNLSPENLKLAPAVVLGNITLKFLGPWMGGVTVFAIVILAITSGDTALRSARLSLSEMIGVDQRPLLCRFAVCAPLIVTVSLLLWWSNSSAKSFGHLWNYFAWGNQMISASTLMAASVWLLRGGRGVKALIVLLPGMFMVSVVTTFILWTSADRGGPWGIVPGGLSLGISTAISIVAAVLFAIFVFRRAGIRLLKKNKTLLSQGFDGGGKRS